MSNGSTDFYVKKGMSEEDAKAAASLARRKQRIYVINQILINISALTWVAMLYNDPSMIKSFSLQEWAIIGVISLVHVGASATNTMLAFMSDPTALHKGVTEGLTKPPPEPTLPPSLNDSKP